MTEPASQSADPAEVVAFWREAGLSRWFAKDAAFDALFRERFLAEHMAAAVRARDGWAEEASGALALMILLDQFPRNAFRGTAHAYATDSLALMFARRFLAAGFDAAFEPDLRLFFYLPFTHSETLADQELSVALRSPLGPGLERAARLHLALIVRFGRFPHRNASLGRTSTQEELDYLAHGGFVG